MLGYVRRALLGAGLATLMVGVFATPVLGATRPLTMDVLIGDGCLGGYAKPNTTIKVTVKDSAGVVKGRDAQLTAPDGSWFMCVGFFSDGIVAGDRIKVIDYDTSQTLNYTVPRMTISVNRVTDVVSGRAPAGMHLELEAADYSADLFGNDPYDVVENLVADGTGSYSHDFSNDGIDLLGGANLEIRTTAAGGNIKTYRDLVVPGLALQFGSPDIFGYLEPFHHVHINVKVGGNKVATGDGVGDAGGSFSSKLIDADGEGYRLAGGEKLSAPALDISWTVPVINGTASKATDEVSGTCFANSPWIVLAGAFGFANGMTGGGGAFNVDFSDQMNLVKGDEVLIVCATSAGDYVEQDLFVQ